MTTVLKMRNLVDELLNYSYYYYVMDAPIVSDVMYDKKFDELAQLEKATGIIFSNSPTQKVQGAVLSSLSKVKHTIPMLSAAKSTELQDVKTFVGNHQAVVSYKEDGSTLVLRYKDGKLVQAITRGNGEYGEDVTHTARTIKNIPLAIAYNEDLEVRGEAVIPYEEYNKLNINGDMGHPRNVASGGLRQLDSNEAAKRNIYFFAFTLVTWKSAPNVSTKADSLSFLNDLGFDVVPHVIIPSGEYVEEALKELPRDTYGIPTDGWCFEYNDLAYGDSLGSTAHHDRRMFALKPEISEYETIFRGVDYNVCRTGVVSLTATFDPVEIDNTVVSRATLHNVDVFNALELGTGDQITVAKFNEIIPGVVDNLTRSNTYELIDTCPSCGGELVIQNTGTSHVLFCPNEQCPSRIASLFEHFVSKPAMNIVGLSSSIIDFLLDKKWISCYADLYHLADHYSEWILCDGFGAKNVTKLLKAVEASRNVSLTNYITALSIPQIGLQAAKTICKQFPTYEQLMNAITNRFDFSTLKDFGQGMNSAIYKFFDANNEIMRGLINELHFESAAQTPTSASLNGATFCITGSLQVFNNRNELVQDIESHGGKVVSSVTSKCNYLINNDTTSNSTKNKKAQELGIKIISEKDYERMKNL